MARRKKELNPVEEMVVGVFLIVATVCAAIAAGVKSAEAGALIALMVCVIALTAILKSAVKKPKFQRAAPGISVSSTSDEAVNGRTFHVQRAECRSTRDHAVSVSDSNGPGEAGRDKRSLKKWHLDRREQLYMYTSCLYPCTAYLRMYACTLVREEASRMATKKSSTPAKPKQSRKAPTAMDGKPVALTLKVDEKTYIRLCTLSAKLRCFNQDILNEALLEHLKRMGA